MIKLGVQNAKRTLEEKSPNRKAKFDESPSSLAVLKTHAYAAFLVFSWFAVLDLDLVVNTV